jgi:flavin-dependent dehydrogenase
MATIHTDVLIIGGGPAGTSAAISLLTYGKVSVTIVEQSDLDQIRIGEHVSASIFDLLKYLNLNRDDFDDGCFLQNFGTTSYWGSDIPVVRDSIFTTEKPGCQLDRENFDLTLLKRVADLGGTVLPRTKCVSFEQRQDKTWDIKLNHITRGTLYIEAKFLIDATGRQGSISRQLGIPTKKYDELFGVGTFLKINGKTLPSDQMIESTEYGWWYSATLNNNYVATVFFSDAAIIAEHEISKGNNWIKLLDKTRNIKPRTSGADMRKVIPWVKSGHTHLSDVSVCRNFLAIGDTIASFDPISSMGIGFALSSGCSAASIVLLELTEHDPERIAVYQNDVNRIFDSYIQLQKKMYRQEKRWLSSSFWKIRA